MRFTPGVILLIVAVVLILLTAFGVNLGVRGRDALGWRSCYPYIIVLVRRQRQSMEISARLSSKGQVTVPRAVREALSLEEGDRLVFRVEGQRAILARTPDLLALAGSVDVPAAKRGTPWAEVRRQTQAARGATRR